MNLLNNQINQCFVYIFLIFFHYNLLKYDYTIGKTRRKKNKRLSDIIVG